MAKKDANRNEPQKPMKPHGRPMSTRNRSAKSTSTDKAIPRNRGKGDDKR